MARQQKVGVRRHGEQERVDARCRIEMLGGLRVRQGEREITRFRAQKYGALLAYLAYYIPAATSPRGAGRAVLAGTGAGGAAQQS